MPCFRIVTWPSPSQVTRIRDGSWSLCAAPLAAAALLTLAGWGGGDGGGSSGGSAGVGGTPVSPNQPAITSQADSILHMDQLRAAGFTGQGIRVGVISTGVVDIASYQSAGLLPASIYISQGTKGSLDEGDWMMELVHQHAPDATLGFCDGDDLDFDGCVKDLATNFQADVIVDDILFSGQFYPDATGDIVTQLEASNDHLVFVHLAGNEQQGGYWQGPFVATQAQGGG